MTIDDYFYSRTSKMLSVSEELKDTQDRKKRESALMDVRSGMPKFHEKKPGFPVVAHLDPETLARYDAICLETGCSFNQLSDIIFKNALSSQAKANALRKTVYKRLGELYGENYKKEAQRRGRRVRIKAKKAAKIS